MITPLELFLIGAAVISAVAFAVIFFGVEVPDRRRLKEMGDG